MKFLVALFASLFLIGSAEGAKVVNFGPLPVVGDTIEGYITLLCDELEQLQDITDAGKGGPAAFNARIEYWKDMKNSFNEPTCLVDDWSGFTIVGEPVKLAPMTTTTQVMDGWAFKVQMNSDPNIFGYVLISRMAGAPI